MHQTAQKNLSHGHRSQEIAVKHYLQTKCLEFLTIGSPIQ